MTPTKPPPVWPFPTWRGVPYTPPKAKPQRKARRTPDGPEAPF